jgi:hypothetical protein
MLYCYIIILIYFAIDILFYINLLYYVLYTKTYTLLYQVTIGIDTTAPIDCDGRNPYLAGEDLVGKGVVLQEGLAVFKNTQAYCSPNGSVGVEFTAMLGGLEVSENLAQSYYIRLKTKLSFRLCSAGEYMLDGECVVCPAGTYSLTETVTKELVCVPCTETEGVAACERDQIVVRDGYWRRYSDNTAVLACPLSPASCTGGNGTGDVLCGEGYGGALCAVCSEGYFPSQSECVECDSTSVLTPTLLIYICAVFAVVSIALLSAYYKWFYVDAEKERASSIIGTQSQSERQSEYGANEEEEPVSRAQLWVLWFKMRYGQIMVKVKIVVVTFQVVTAVPTVMSVSMPNSFNSFVDGFYFINLSFSDAFPLSCSGTFTFIDKLVLTTLAPIIVSIMLCMFFFMEYGYQRRQIQSNRSRKKGEKAAAFNATKEKYLNYFFYLTYLVLPSVTTTIFQTFLCTDVDPDDEDYDESDSYLTADMNISCKSDYYRRGLSYAVFMILVYPIGVTAMYLALLYCNRSELLGRDSEEGSPVDSSLNPMQTSSAPAPAPAPTPAPTLAPAPASASASDVSGETLSPSAARLAFLWEAYEPKFW